jgi:hypothetical protein
MGWRAGMDLMVFIPALAMPDPTAIPSCSACSEPIPDPAERWPDNATGTVCQVCWLLPEDGAHA